MMGFHIELLVYRTVNATTMPTFAKLSWWYLSTWPCKRTWLQIWRLGGEGGEGGRRGGRGVARRGLGGNTMCIYICIHILSIYIYSICIVLYTDHYWYISYNHSEQQGWRPFPAVTMAAVIVFRQSALQHALLLIPRRLEPWMNGHMGFS